jgi:hypothetical protein
MASISSGMRSANETGSPCRSAGAIVRARSLSASDAAVAVERDHRIRQTGDHGPKEIVAALGDGDRPRQAIVLPAERAASAAAAATTAKPAKA